jgi:hypothetical protein
VTSLRRKRQLEGLKAAKGVDEVERLRPTMIAKRLKIGRTSVYRLLLGQGEGSRSGGVRSR